MVWRVLKQYGMTKASEVLDDFATAVAAFAPAEASRGQLEVMVTELQKLGRRLAEIEAEVAWEQRETARLRRRYDDYLAAAHILSAGLNAGRGPTEQLELSLSRMVDRLEQLKPEIEREERDDGEVETWRAELRSAFEALSGKLHAAKPRPEAGRSRRDDAEAQDRRAREAAAMTSSISALSVALDGMNQQAAGRRAETEVFQLKAGILQAEQLESDPQIAAALERVRGTERDGAQALSARLAALGDRPGPLRLSAAE